MKIEFKRGYAKWRDESGKLHKIPIEEYNRLNEDDSVDEEMGDTD